MVNYFYCIILFLFEFLFSLFRGISLFYLNCFNILSNNKSLILVECTLNLDLEQNTDLISFLFDSIYEKFKNKITTKILLVIQSSDADKLNEILHAKHSELYICTKSKRKSKKMMQKKISTSYG